MSLALYPPTSRKVHLWGIFFALLAINGLLSAELKCRENTVTAQFIVCNSVSFLIIEVKLFQAFLIFMCYLTAGYLVQV